MADIAQTGQCPICHAEFKPYPMGDKNGYVLVACSACGSVMTENRVTEEEREKFLADIEPQITHVPKPQNEIDELKKTIAKIMPNGSGKRFLDINCRNGYAVMAAKELGFIARGIDAHDFFINFAQSKYDAARFEQKTVFQAVEEGEQADFIFIREAFTEQTNPDAYAGAIAQLLAPKGVVYIEEPDGNNFNTPRYFAGWPVVYPPLNFFYFSKQGMKALLKRHGLTVKKTIFSWRPVMRLIAGKK